LLYIGKATEQTVARRLRQHESWLSHEWPIRVYVGRIYVPERHSACDQWRSWRLDVELAERLLISKYSPHYNAVSISETPRLGRHARVALTHRGQFNRLRQRDEFPRDFG
jgi:hypothetical protein